jgi:hypothetical protein
VGNISAASVGRVKGTPNNGEKEKMIVIAAVEDLSSEAEAAELSGAKVGEDTLRISAKKTQKGAARGFGVEAWAGEARTVKREKDSLEATMSRTIGVEDHDTDVWAEQVGASTAEASANSIGTSMKMKNICPATTNTNQTLIGIGSSVKYLRI